jgi:RHS repeat-associated protein
VVSAGSFSFGYDANGNMTSRNGSSISYTSYNLPAVINAGTGTSSTLSYGAFRNRYKQIAVTPTSTETTITIAGLLEKVTRGSQIEYRHLIQGGQGAAAIHTRVVGGASSTYYLHRDHLGSPELITDSSGNEVVRPSFGAYGERRDGTDWSGPPSTADLTDIANTIRRGFTGHEHLDSVGLIHMNGRVYEPIAGRFLSKDPIVHVGLGQSPNSYSYVWNNPLTLIDPSGLDPPPPDGSDACNPQCPDVPVTGPRPRRPRIPTPGGGSGQVESASQRDPCGQDSSQMACDEAEGLLSEFIDEVVTQLPEIVDEIQGFACYAAAQHVINLSNLPGSPVSFDSPNENMAVHLYFQGAPEGFVYRLTPEEFAQAAQVTATNPFIIDDGSFVGVGGIQTAQVNFGNNRLDNNSLIDGLLGSAAGTFQIDEHGGRRLVQVTDTFNFDHKDRGSFLVNVATDATRLLAEAICSNPNGFRIVGGQ